MTIKTSDNTNQEGGNSMDNAPYLMPHPIQGLRGDLCIMQAGIPKDLKPVVGMKIQYPSSNKEGERDPQIFWIDKILDDYMIVKSFPVDLVD